MASSIHIEKVKTGSFLHNDRTIKVSYLISNSENNYCSTSSKDAIQKFKNLKTQAEENYKNRTGQKLQKSVNFLKEAIINLEEHHTEKDLKPIIEKLESFGFTILQTSIHRDEGFKNEDDKNKFNYHCHITMFNLDVDTGKTIKFGKNYRTELSRLQTFTADTLKMDRGSCSVEEVAKELNVTTSKATRRLGTHEYKQAMKEQDKILAKQKDLKIEVSKLRAELKENQATREDYAKVEQLNKDLRLQVNEKDLTIESLHKQLTEARETILNQNTSISTKKEQKELLGQNMNSNEHNYSNLENEETFLKLNKLLLTSKEIKEGKSFLNKRELVQRVHNIKKENSFFKMKLIEINKLFKKSLNSYEDIFETIKNKFTTGYENIFEKMNANTDKINRDNSLKNIEEKSNLNSKRKRY